MTYTRSSLRLLTSESSWLSGDTVLADAEARVAGSVIIVVEVGVGRQALQPVL